MCWIDRVRTAQQSSSCSLHSDKLTIRLPNNGSPDAGFPRAEPLWLLRTSRVGVECFFCALREPQEVTEHLCVHRRRDSRVYTSLARHLQLVRWLFSVRSLAHTNHFIFILQKSYRYSLGSVFRSSWVWRFLIKEGELVARIEAGVLCWGTDRC